MLTDVEMANIVEKLLDFAINHPDAPKFDIEAANGTPEENAVEIEMQSGQIWYAWIEESA